jgi:hypothetical protein
VISTFSLTAVKSPELADGVTKDPAKPGLLASQARFIMISREQASGRIHHRTQLKQNG